MDQNYRYNIFHPGGTQYVIGVENTTTAPEFIEVASSENDVWEQLSHELYELSENVRKLRETREAVHNQYPELFT